MINKWFRKDKPIVKPDQTEFEDAIPDKLVFQPQVILNDAVVECWPHIRTAYLSEIQFPFDRYNLALAENTLQGYAAAWVGFATFLEEYTDIGSWKQLVRQYGEKLLLRYHSYMRDIRRVAARTAAQNGKMVIMLLASAGILLDKNQMLRRTQMHDVRNSPAKGTAKPFLLKHRALLMYVPIHKNPLYDLEARLWVLMAQETVLRYDSQQRLRWDDLVVIDDTTVKHAGKGAIYSRSGKNYRKGDGHMVGLSQESMVLLKQWHKVSGKPLSGPIFPRATYDRVLNFWKKVSLAIVPNDRRRFTAHSARVGSTQEMVRLGVRRSLAEDTARMSDQTFKSYNRFNNALDSGTMQMLQTAAEQGEY